MSMRIRTKQDYDDAYKESVENPEAFWDKIAQEFYWQKKYDKVLDWNFDEPNIKWFVNGKLNITENCLDRHLDKRGNKTALIWEPNDPRDEVRKFTYKELYHEVCKVANMLKQKGIKKGDRVCIYLPMVPELTFAILACARIGAIHSVVFAGFSAKSLADRINDSDCKALLTSDGSRRGAKTIDLKSITDEALKTSPSIENVIILKNTGAEIDMQDERYHWWHEALEDCKDECPAETMDSEDELYILYTSGSTGKPKGVVHTCGGYMVSTAYTFLNVFQYDEKDVYWCTADIGWVTGHSYIIYGPLACGATTMMFEGIPTYPDAGRMWDIVDKHQVNIFYTAPTAIRALQAQGTDYVTSRDLSSLKVLGSVGEPINEEAWNWYYKYVGKEKCPLVDTWWQTETGAIMISALAGITKTKPAYATLPLPGVQPVLMDKEGKEITEPDVEGRLCIKFPWPSIIRTTYGDHKRCKEVYFSDYKDMYFSGDGCKRDTDGNYRITGRVDDVINVSGHRFGTAEIEEAINEHKNVVESAVVGYPHDIKGKGIYAYVTCEKEPDDVDATRKEIAAIVNKQIGPIAKPDKIQFVKDLPKTRSGKIMRRILRKIAEGKPDELGNISTLLNPDVVESVKENAL